MTNKTWQKRKLGEVCDIKGGKNQVKVLNPNGKYPIYGSSGIFGYSDEYLCDEGTTIIGRKGTINSPIYVKTKFWNVDTAFGLCSMDSLNSKFLYFFCTGFNFHKLDKSTTIPSLAKRDIQAIEIPIPPLPEQEAIVSKIEELLSDLENGKQQLLTAQKQLKVYRQSLLKWAFEGKLTNKNVNDGAMPKGWRWVKLRDICKIIGGVTKGKDYKGQPTIALPYLRVANVQDGYLDMKVIKTIEVLPSDLDKYRLLYGDILYTEGGDKDKLGRGTIWKNEMEDCIHQNHIFRARPLSESSNSKYIAYFSQTQSAKNYFFKHGKQTTNLASINLTILSGLPIPLCSKEEQQLIVDELENKLTVCDKIEETIAQSLLQSESLRQSILKKAFEGKLVKATSSEINVSQTSFIEFPKKIENISTTDLHAGIIALVVDAHEKNPKHLNKLNHVKCEKISHMIEYKLGISLGRYPVKDAAGPDDYPHLRKVEHRANKANWFGIRKLEIGKTYFSKSGIKNAVTKIETILSKEDLIKINELVHTFLPFEMEHAELIATLYAGWNNLLIQGSKPSDEEIVFESRENWSVRKLTIEREKFFKTLNWMKTHGYIPEGKGNIVLKSEKAKFSSELAVS